MKAFITDYIDNPYIEEKILGSSLTLNPNDPDITSLLVWHQKINSNYISKFPNLKFVCRYGVGFDQIDLKLLEQKNIIFSNTPDYGVDEVSDTALAFLLSYSRGIFKYNEYSKAYKNNSWQENTISELKRASSLKVGVIGAGRIGGRFSIKSRQLGFDVQIYDPYKPSGHEKLLGVSRISNINELLSSSDIISIHCPLTKETRGLINKEFISNIKRGAYLINTARGEILDSLDTLDSALSEGILSAVALDVLPEEPPNKNSSLIKNWIKNNYNSRVIINPHSSYYSKESYVEMRVKASQNVLNFLKGIKPINQITSGDLF